MVDIRLEIPDGFLDEEIRDGYKVSRQMKEVWAVELDLLSMLDEVCKKLGLRYFLDSGTLLGAVRGKKFIPWDDDIDVVMFREDFEQLISEGQEYFREPYFLQSAYSDRGYYRCHAQLRNSNTTGMLLNEGEKVPFNQGIFIDIFVLDGIPEDRKKAIKAVKKQNWYRFMIRCMTAQYENSQKIKSIAKVILGKMFKIIYRSPLDVYAVLKTRAMKWEDSEYVDKIWWNSNFNRIHYLEKEWYSQCVFVSFEWLQFPIPIHYDDVLKEYYGAEYMKPKQAPNAHGTVIFDTNISYSEYIKNLKA